MDKNKSKKRKFNFSKKKLFIILIFIIAIITLHIISPTQRAYRAIKKINIPDKMSDTLQLPTYSHKHFPFSIFFIRSFTSFSLYFDPCTFLQFLLLTATLIAP